MSNERILDVFPASNDLHRTVLAVITGESGQPEYVLRQETFSSDVGWFVQSRVSLEPSQMEGLKAALTCGRTRVPADDRPARRSRPGVPALRIAAAG